jgi:hypothetical protein
MHDSAMRREWLILLKGIKTPPNFLTIDFLKIDFLKIAALKTSYDLYRKGTALTTALTTAFDHVVGPAH